MPQRVRWDTRSCENNIVNRGNFFWVAVKLNERVTSPDTEKQFANKQLDGSPASNAERKNSPSGKLAKTNQPTWPGGVKFSLEVVAADGAAKLQPRTAELGHFAGDAGWHRERYVGNLRQESVHRRAGDHPATVELCHCDYHGSQGHRPSDEFHLGQPEPRATQDSVYLLAAADHRRHRHVDFAGPPNAVGIVTGHRTFHHSLDDLEWSCHTAHGSLACQLRTFVSRSGCRATGHDARVGRRAHRASGWILPRL